jgi:hypothetical protein
MLMIQHYVADVREPHLCRMVSISDAITSAGRNKVQVVWQLTAKKIDDKACEYSDHLHARTTDEFLGISQEKPHPLRKSAGCPAAGVRCS